MTTPVEWNWNPYAPLAGPPLAPEPRLRQQGEPEAETSETPAFLDYGRDI
jgi:hypothetical protein